MNKDPTLKEFRTEKNLAQHEVAKACGCSQYRIHKLEKKGAICTYNPAIKKLAIYVNGLLEQTGDLYQ